MSEQIYSSAVIYLRVSTKEQAQKGGEAEGYSIPAQRAACLKKAEALGIRVVDEFVDAGESAKTSSRPQLRAMLARLEKGGVQYVIVHKIDRLARNRVDDVTINVAIKQAGAKLVSVSENIDETPSGHLMHGIMSSIAEFYSQNLANEVMKGMSQKAKKGGTLNKAPIGYLNIPKVIDSARVSTVEVDEVRAPLVQWAFQAYATGRYSLITLTDVLAAKGLVKPARKNTPPSPLGRSGVYKMLRNKYYTGKVSWNGVVYDGSHTPLVSYRTFQQVQDVLDGHRVANDRQREHNHHLRGSIWCRICNSRLCFSQTTNRHGVVYDYFFCAGHKRKDSTCTVKYLEAEKIEDRVKEQWKYAQLDPTYMKLLREIILEELRQIYTDNEQLKIGAQAKRTQIMKEQKKLLEAHYADAISLPLLKEEQDRLARELDEVEQNLRDNVIAIENIEKNLDKCLEMVRNCHEAYVKSEPNGRRLMNQAVFRQIHIDQNESEVELTEAFGLLLSPDILRPLSSTKKEEGTDALPPFVHKSYLWSDGAPAWLRNGQWWPKISVILSENQNSNLGNSLMKIGLGWNKETLVRVRGL